MIMLDEIFLKKLISIFQLSLTVKELNKIYKKKGRLEFALNFYSSVRFEKIEKIANDLDYSLDFTILADNGYFMINIFIDLK